VESVGGIAFFVEHLEVGVDFREIHVSGIDKVGRQRSGICYEFGLICVCNQCHRGIRKSCVGNQRRVKNVAKHQIIVIVVVSK